ncbi:hypothetical protein [Achromobacter seleniivolatilans]|uniref:hypothetical protein n=1 Tax=Achromobacter seleniivolatilans TaxID=3047478 RepID=UPI003526F128
MQAFFQNRHLPVQHRRFFQFGDVLAADQTLPDQQLAFTVALQGHTRIQCQRRAVQFADHLAALERLAHRYHLIDAITNHPSDCNRDTAGKQSDVHGCIASWMRENQPFWPATVKERTRL